jgi:hypothetical protein
LRSVDQAGAKANHQNQVTAFDFASFAKAIKS